MRKLFCCLAVIAALIVGCASASAEVYVLDGVKASIEIPEGYVVLTPDNLSSYAQWLESRGTTMELTQADMQARGVLLQCWNANADVCVEVTAIQTDYTLNVFDVNEQSTFLRGSYRTSHFPDNKYEGYDFTSSDWKNTDNGRFLVLKYNRKENGETIYKGLMRRTIRNGYQVTIDMQIYGRAIIPKDNTALNKIWKTFTFVEVLPMPGAAAAMLNITQEPPTETNEASFNIVGTAADGVQLTAVVMGLSSPDPVLFQTTVGKSGKFKLPIKLPKEGAFLITMTAEYNGEATTELAYPVTYQRTLLAVNITTEIPQVLTGDVLAIKGEASPSATIQILVNGENSSKRVTDKGKFALEINTAEEGTYEIVLVFSKKGLADRRLTFTCIRKWTDADSLKKLSAEAISPGYKTLVSKINGYDGRVMGYKCYVVSVSQAGEDYVLQLALTKRASGYQSVILATTSEQPTVEPAQHVLMYGTCVGMSVPDTDLETGTTGNSYPCFDLLLIQRIAD